MSAQIHDVRSITGFYPANGRVEITFGPGNHNRKEEVPLIGYAIVVVKRKDWVVTTELHPMAVLDGALLSAHDLRDDYGAERIAVRPGHRVTTPPVNPDQEKQPMGSDTDTEEHPVSDDIIQQAAEAIRGVTDLWDEPLDEVHDVPQIVNALATKGLLCGPERDAEMQMEGRRQIVAEMSVTPTPEDVAREVLGECVTDDSEEWCRTHAASLDMYDPHCRRISEVAGHIRADREAVRADERARVLAEFSIESASSWESGEVDYRLIGPWLPVGDEP